MHTHATSELQADQSYSYVFLYRSTHVSLVILSTVFGDSYLFVSCHGDNDNDDDDVSSNMHNQSHKKATPHQFDELLRICKRVCKLPNIRNCKIKN